MDGKRMALAASALVVLAACATAGEGGGGGGSVGEGDSGVRGAPQVEGVDGVAIPLPGVRPTVIKTATLRLEVDPAAPGKR